MLVVETFMQRPLLIVVLAVVLSVSAAQADPIRHSDTPPPGAVPRLALPDGPPVAETTPPANTPKVMVLPEPGEWALFALGVAGLVVVRHRART